MNNYKLVFLSLLFWLVSATSIWAQFPQDIVQSFGVGSSFSALQDTVERYYSVRDKGKGSGYKQWKRTEYWMRQHLDSLGQITNWPRLNFDAADVENQQRMPMNGSWLPLGPTDYQVQGGWNPGLGRINCFAFHPTNGTVYAGASGGGLWRGTYVATNYTWTYLSTSIPVPGVSGVVVHPNNPDVLYILTGDGDGADNPSIGVLKSLDGGLSWATTGLTFPANSFVRGHKLGAWPGNPDVIYAATSNGLYRTIDGANNWTMVLAGNISDFEFSPQWANTIYASTYGPALSYCDNLGAPTEVWQTAMATNMPTWANRVVLAVTPASPNVVYALASPNNGTGQYAGVFRSTDNGGVYTRMSNTPNVLGYPTNGQDNKNQGTYDLALVASLTTANRVLTGGINIWRTTDGGSNLSCVTQWDWPTGGFQYSHADIHALAGNPVDGRVYCGSDGGVFVSLDDGDTWTNVSIGLSLSQPYRLDVKNDDPSYIVSGLQDNGTILRRTGFASWQNVMGADGMDAIFESNDPNIIYGTIQNGGLYLTTNGLNFNDVSEPVGGGSWVTPILPDPLYGNCILYGTGSGVWWGCRSGGSMSWSQNLGGSAANVLATESNYMYGASGDQMMRFDGNVWANLTEPWSGNISGITVNPDNLQEVWVTISGYTATQKVYRSTNGGNTWTNFSTGLPNVPANCIDFHDANGAPGGAVYVGTDLGVYYRDDGTAGWTPFTNYLPRGASVTDLEVHESSGSVYISTYGHGIWAGPLYSSCPSAIAFFGVRSGYFYEQASNYIQAVCTVQGGVGTEVRLKGGDYVDLDPGFQTIGPSFFEAKTGPCAAGPPSNRPNATVEQRPNSGSRTQRNQ